MKKLCLVFVVFCVTACTTTTPQLSTSQRYFAAKQDLESLLTAAVSYKETCEQLHVNNSCHGHVKEMHKIAPKIAFAFDAAEGYRTNDDNAMLIASTSIILGFTREISQYLVR